MAAIGCTLFRRLFNQSTLPVLLFALGFFHHHHLLRSVTSCECNTLFAGKMPSHSPLGRSRSIESLTAAPLVAAFVPNYRRRRASHRHCAVTQPPIVTRRAMSDPNPMVVHRHSMHHCPPMTPTVVFDLEPIVTHYAQPAHAATRAIMKVCSHRFCITTNAPISPHFHH